MTRPLALITGASGGIGAAFATVFAQNGYDLVLTARSLEPMEQLGRDLRAYGATTTALAFDLGVAENVRALVGALAERGLVVDALVNNAGYGSYGLFAETPLAEQMGEISLNVAALTELTHRLLPAMLARKHGYVLNVASTAAFIPGPYMAVYFATKAFVLSFSEALASELAQTGVSVTCLCPGGTVTGFQHRANMTDSPIMQGRLPDAATVARFGYDAMIARKTTVVHGLSNRVVTVMPRIFPRGIVPALVKRAQAPRR
jgi:short-subunit dehydrogenase